MKYELTGEFGWTGSGRTESVRGAKIKGTNALVYGCGDMTLSVDGKTFVRRFWSEPKRFGWENWAEV